MGRSTSCCWSFPEDADSKACADAVMDLVKEDVIRLYDVPMDVIRSGSQRCTSAGVVVGGFTGFQGARSGVIHDEEVRTAVEVMQPGTMAALSCPNTWPAPFVGAAIEAVGELIASRRIPAPDVIETLERLNASQSS
jgi:hypothetical protein